MPKENPVLQKEFQQKGKTSYSNADTLEKHRSKSNRREKYQIRAPSRLSTAVTFPISQKTIHCQ